ncbi:MAG: WecB/TagA/CpsF family glycosyltransferase [Gemmatimonadetes bacterium]|nr:WecB/TagA/CpsF family glycosyltransferase [Gemmatimonadota bacterium]
MTTGAPSFAVFGKIRIDAHTMASAVARMEALIRAGQAQYVCVTSVHTTMTCAGSEDMAEVNNNAGMVIPDGMPVVWYGRWRGQSLERVAGADFMAAFLTVSEQKRYRHFLYGSTEETLAKLRRRLGERWPAARVVGAFSPPFQPWTAADLQAAADMIDAADPDVVWVGLGAPKQERWMAAMRPLLRRAIMVGVGAAFDFHAGTVQRAPAWMQRSGLEWLHRLALEPRRLWRRYVSTNCAFLGRWLVEAVGWGRSAYRFRPGTQR